MYSVEVKTGMLVNALPIRKKKTISHFFGRAVFGVNLDK